MIAILTVMLIVALMFAITTFVPKLPLTFGRRDGFARIKLGPNVTDIRGTIKEVVYSIWKSGVHYIRAKAGIISNPQSSQQANIRNIVTLASKHWFDTLTGNQRENWNEFAAGQEPQEGDAGGILNIIPQNRGIMSGFNAYTMCYALVVRSGIVPPVGFNDSPLGQTPPSAPTGLAGIWNTPNVELSWVDPVTVIEDSMVRVWLRSRQLHAHRQINSSIALAVQIRHHAGFRGAQGAEITYVDAPGHYLYQLDTIQPNGLKSNPSQTIEVVVT